MANKPFHRGGMFNGANPLIFDMAKKHRNNMTPAEMVLWSAIRSEINGFKFRRQHPLGNYIVDFSCHKLKLVIELDGSIHNLPDVIEKDRQKQSDLERDGYTLLRLSNEEVTSDTYKIVEHIKATIKTLTQIQSLTNT